MSGLPKVPEVSNSSSWQVAEEWDGATPVLTKRFYGQGFITYSGGVGTSYFYTRDHLGSIREVLDGTGAIKARYDCDPYGVVSLVQGTNLADFQYTANPAATICPPNSRETPFIR